jgi:RHS repeat-associated protein
MASIGYTDFYNYTVGYGYDPASNITRITYPTSSGNKNVTCAYYDDNRLRSVTDWNGKKTEYFYRADGSIQQINYPNSTYTTYSYDNADRLTGITHRNSGGEVIASFTYTLDEIGNITNEDRNIPLEATGYSPVNISLSYDNANRIQSAGSSSFTSNANGNITSQTGGKNLTYAFDTENRLTGISGDQSASNVYDAFGSRRQATRNGTTTRYVLDVNGSMSKVLIEKDSNGNDLYYYVYGIGLVYRIKADGTYEYYHYNNVGSTIAITNASQNVTHKYAYDPFGKVMNSQEADYNPYRFVGQFGVMDEGNGHYFMRARFYDADVGRFLIEDQMWDINLFIYSTNNPLIKTDPNGTYWLKMDSWLYGHTNWADNRKLVKTAIGIKFICEIGLSFVPGGSFVVTGFNLIPIMLDMTTGDLSQKEALEQIPDLALDLFSLKWSKYISQKTRGIDFLHNKLWGHDMELINKSIEWYGRLKKASLTYDELIK